MSALVDYNINIRDMRFTIITTDFLVFFFFFLHVLYSIICGSRLLVVTGYWIENTIQSRVAPGQKRKDILCVNREFRSRMYS